MAKMEKLRELAKQLKSAYAAQDMMEKALREAQQRQSYWRSEIVKILGQDEAGEFLDMLREQAGFLVSDDLHEMRVDDVLRRFPK